MPAQGRGDQRPLHRLQGGFVHYLRQVLTLWSLLAWLAAAQAYSPTLQIDYALAGTTAGLTADCVAGAHLPGDNRWCDGSTGAIASTAGNTLFGDGHALFPGHGMDTQAWARARFGVLGAYAQTTATSVDAFYNVQSRGASEMTDFITATNTAASALTTYHYTVTVHGSLSAPIGCGGQWPCADASVAVAFNTSPMTYCPSCQGVVDNWSSVSGKAADTVYSGSFSMASGVTFQMRLSLDTSSYVNLFQTQSASALADYGSTVTLQLSAVTAGANTVGVSGYDYATSPVPEPATGRTTALGLLVVLGTAALRRWREG